MTKVYPCGTRYELRPGVSVIMVDLAHGTSCPRCAPKTIDEHDGVKGVGN